MQPDQPSSLSSTLPPVAKPTEGGKAASVCVKNDCTPREVYEQPANEFVARFIGVMNILELTVEKDCARINELEFPAHGLQPASG